MTVITVKAKLERCPGHTPQAWCLWRDSRFWNCFVSALPVHRHQDRMPGGQRTCNEARSIARVSLIKKITNKTTFKFLSTACAVPSATAYIVSATSSATFGQDVRDFADTGYLKELGSPDSKIGICSDLRQTQRHVHAITLQLLHVPIGGLSHLHITDSGHRPNSFGSAGRWLSHLVAPITRTSLAITHYSHSRPSRSPPGGNNRPAAASDLARSEPEPWGQCRVSCASKGCAGCNSTCVKAGRTPMRRTRPRPLSRRGARGRASMRPRSCCLRILQLTELHSGGAAEALQGTGAMPDVVGRVPGCRFCACIAASSSILRPRSRVGRAGSSFCGLLRRRSCTICACVWSARSDLMTCCGSVGRHPELLHQ